MFRKDLRVKRDIQEMENNVDQGCMTAGEPAEILLHHFVPEKNVLIIKIDLLESDCIQLHSS